MNGEFPETAKQRFMRNHEDNVNRMKAAVVRERRLGNHDKANAMQRIVDQWEGIYSDARNGEDD